MTATYNGLGFHMMYPENWKIEEEENSETVMLESPSGAYLTITRCQDLQSAFQLARETMEIEYEEVESEEVEYPIGDRSLSGITQRFVYLDLIVVSHLLQLPANHANYVLQIQGEDKEFDRLEPVFQALITSVIRSLDLDASNQSKPTSTNG